MATRRVSAALAIAAVVLGLAACSDESSDGPKADGERSRSERPMRTLPFQHDHIKVDGEIVVEGWGEPGPHDRLANCFKAADVGKVERRGGTALLKVTPQRGGGVIVYRYLTQTQIERYLATDSYLERRRSGRRVANLSPDAGKELRTVTATCLRKTDS